MPSLTEVKGNPFTLTEVEGNPFGEAKLTPVEGNPFKLTEVEGSPFSQAAQDQANGVAPEDDGVTFEDVGRKIMAGGAHTGSGIGYGIKKLGEYTDSPSLKLHGGVIQEMGKDAAETWNSGLSETAKNVEKVPLLKENEDSLLGYEWNASPLQTMQKATLMMGESALGTLAGMAAGGGFTAPLKVAAKFIPGVTKAVGGTIAAALGYSAGEAIVAAPGAGAQAEQEVLAMTEAQLAGHVEYEAIRLTGDDFETARAKLASAAGGDAMATTAITTAVLSGPFGKALDGALGGEAASALGGFLKGAGAEAAQEFFQSGAEQGSINLAMLTNAEKNRSLMKDVPEAMVGGALAGAGMGGPMGALAGRQEGMRQADLEAQRRADAVREAGGDDLDAELARQSAYEEAERVAMPPEGQYMPDAGPTGPDAPIPYNPYQQTMQGINLGSGGPTMPGQGAPVEWGDDSFLPDAGPQIPAGMSGSVSGSPVGNEIQFNPEFEGPLPEQAGPNLPQPQRPIGVDQGIRPTTPPLNDLPPAGSAELLERRIEQYQQGYGPEASGPLREPLAPVDEAQLGPAGPSARQAMEDAEVDALEAESQRLQKGMPKVKGNQKYANPDMELQQAIATLGGLDMDEAAAQGIDPASFGQRAGGIARLFRKTKGKTFDEMAEALGELGFFDGEEVSPNTLLAKLSESLAGRQVFSPRGTVGPARAGVQLEIDRIEQEIGRLKTNYDDDQNDPPHGAAFGELDDKQKELAYTVMEAEAEGIDPIAIDMMMDTPGPIEDTIAKLRSNIDNAKRRRKSQGQNQGGREGYTEAPQGPVNQAEVSGAEGGTGTGQSDDVGQNAGSAGADTGAPGAQSQNNGPTDLFGAVPIKEQSLADVQRQKDEKRNGTKDVDAGADGGLFSSESQQADITDAAPAQPRGQGSVFDVSPALNADVVKRIKGWQQRLRAARALFDDRSPDVGPRKQKEIDDLLAGMEETIQTGQGLANLPSEEDANRAIRRFEESAARQPSKQDWEATQETIRKNQEAKTARLKAEGNYAKPFESLGSIPGIDLTDAMWGSFDQTGSGIDWAPVVQLAEETRQKANAGGIYDSQQDNTAGRSDAGILSDMSIGEISGSSMRLAMDITGFLNGDKRTSEAVRRGRIEKYGEQLGVDVSGVLAKGFGGAQDATLAPEEVEDADGNIIKVTQKVAPLLAKLDKRLAVLDKVLGCLLT